MSQLFALADLENPQKSVQDPDASGPEKMVIDYSVVK